MAMPISTGLVAQNDDSFDFRTKEPVRSDIQIEIISQQVFDALKSGEVLNNFNHNLPKFIQTIKYLKNPKIKEKILILMKKDCYAISKQVKDKDPLFNEPETIQKLFRTEFAKQVINKELGVINISSKNNKEEVGALAFKAIITDFNTKVQGPWTCEEDLDTFLLPYLLDENYLNRIIGVLANKTGESSTSILEACNLGELGKKLAYPLNQGPLPYLIDVNANENLNVEKSNAIYDREEAEKKVNLATAAKHILMLGSDLGFINIPIKRTFDITSLLYPSGEPANTNSYNQVFDFIDQYNQKLLEAKPLLIDQYLSNLLHKKAYDERDEQEALIAAKEKMNEREVEITRKHTEFEENKQKKVQIKRGFDLRNLFGRSKTESSKTPNPYAAEKAVLKFYKEKLELQEAKREVEKDFLKMYRAATVAMLIKIALNNGQIFSNEIIDACRKRKIKDIEL